MRKSLEYPFPRICVNELETHSQIDLMYKHKKTITRTVWFNLFNSTMIGFMTAIDTLLAQTYGANQHDNFAVWTGNSLVIVFLATVIVSGMVALCGPAM